MKTKITAYDLKEIFSNLFYDFDYTIIVEEADGTKKEISITEYLRTEFYTYTRDLREERAFDDYDGGGFNFPNFDNIVASLGKVSTSYAQVELEGIEVVASEDIDMGSATARISFIVQVDKSDILERHLSDLRSGIAGHSYSFTNAEKKKVDFYATIGDIVYDEEPFDTPIGKCIVLTTTFGMSYIQEALTSNNSIVEISLDGTNFERLLYTQDNEEIMFTGKPNLVNNKPYASGTVVSSVSYVRVVSYWIFTNNCMQLELNHKLKLVVNDTTTWTDNINIPVWIRENVPYYDNGEFKYQAITTKMVVVDYKINKKNCDFVNVNLTLNRYGK